MPSHRETKVLPHPVSDTFCCVNMHLWGISFPSFAGQHFLLLFCLCAVDCISCINFFAQTYIGSVRHVFRHLANKHNPKSRSRRTVNNLSKFDELSGGSQMPGGDSSSTSDIQTASFEREISRPRTASAMLYHHQFSGEIVQSTRCASYSCGGTYIAKSFLWGDPVESSLSSITTSIKSKSVSVMFFFNTFGDEFPLFHLSRMMDLCRSGDRFCLFGSKTKPMYRMYKRIFMTLGGI